MSDGPSETDTYEHCDTAMLVDLKPRAGLLFVSLVPAVHQASYQVTENGAWEQVHTTRSP